jgi:Fanconi anemia group M protein
VVRVPQAQKTFEVKGKVVIICDYRERDVINELTEFDVVIKEMPLEVGDYVLSDRVIVERKTSRDFVKSIVDGRIFEQARSMQESFEKPILIVEGYETPWGIAENALKGAIASLILDFGISILRTDDASDTARTMYWIARREQVGAKRKVILKPRRKPKEVEKLQEQIVAGLPGISGVLSQRLLKHFKTVENVFKASAEELRKVQGIGEQLAKRIRRVLTQKYK